MFERFYLNRLCSIDAKNERRIYKLLEDIWDLTPNIEKLFSRIGDGYSSLELLLNGHTSYFCGYFEGYYLKTSLPIFIVLNKDNGTMFIIPINKRCKAKLKKAILLKNDEYQIYHGGRSCPSSSDELMCGNNLGVGFFSEKIGSSFRIDMMSVTLWIPEKSIPDDLKNKRLPYLSQSNAFFDVKEVVYEMLKEHSKAQQERNSYADSTY